LACAHAKAVAEEILVPELPEVETLARAMARRIGGGQLIKSEFFREDLRDPIPIQEFQQRLSGQHLHRIYRRSKYLILDFGDYSGVIHLGMTGNIIERRVDTPTPAHVHAQFCFAVEGAPITLQYVDPRRFGRIDVVESAKLSDHKFFVKLGPEPLELSFPLASHLWRKSRGRKVPVKVFLMDANNVVGVGNIYASEALWRAGVNPSIEAGKISQKRYELICQHIRETLLDAIEQGGTSFRDFKHLDGNTGYFVQRLNVYGRKDQECQRCGKLILEIRQGGRSTFYCRGCQQ
jgi:formamidopyrimidine-DNA glycosylase